MFRYDKIEKEKKSSSLRLTKFFAALHIAQLDNHYKILHTLHVLDLA